MVRRDGLTQALQVDSSWFFLFHRKASARSSIGRLPEKGIPNTVERLG
jgi:hypothetical protein